MFHSLHLQPVLDLAVNKYAESVREQTGIELAINLLLLNPRYPHLLLINGARTKRHSSTTT